MARSPLDDVLYPPLVPYSEQSIVVDDIHTLHVEECGNPQGKPVVFLHGGPGGGCSPMHRRFWDPTRYRIVLVDQRGCGRSTPHASLTHNTTWHLVADLERVREALGITRWQVFGGSWGSTLALAYASKHPGRVSELILRGIFLMREKELRWFYQDGANRIFPEAWRDFLAPIAAEERHDLLGAYHRAVTSDDRERAIRCARAWSLWEGRACKLLQDPEEAALFADPIFAQAFARIETHYFVNHGFLPQKGGLLSLLEGLEDIDIVIVHGRYDVICPFENAWDLKQRLPHALLRVVPDAGHSAFEIGIAKELTKATARFA